MSTYRAVVHTTDDGQGELVLTGPEHADWTDEAMIEEAVAEARRGRLIDDEYAERDLRSHLSIMMWTD